MTDINTIHEGLKAQGLKFVTRKSEPSLWRDVWSKLPYQAVDYGAEMLDYQHEYLKSAGWEVEDASLILLSGSMPMGLWALTLARKEGVVSLTSCGQPVYAPLFLNHISPKSKKRFCAMAMFFLIEYHKRSASLKLSLQQDYLPTTGVNSISEWHRQILQVGGIATPRYMLYTDISQNMDTIRSSFRKSYKPLINRALREWKVFIMDVSDANREIWQEFQQLHIQVSGRKTRSDLSWDMQFNMIASGHGFLIGLRSPEDGRLVGGGFFQNTRDEALYSVGVYDRSLFDKPLGHAVQGSAIEYMKSLGLQWYKIGERHYSQDIPVPTDKEVSISVFKEGLASNMHVKFQFHLTDQSQ